MSAKDDIAGELAPFAALPRFDLIGGSTPLMAQNRLTQSVGGANLWLKRDDLIPFGFGGNKVRGLELLLADALAQDADLLITGAGSLSNHVRATAATAQMGNLDMVACYWGPPPDVVQGNYRLVRLLGAEARFSDNMDRNSVDTLIETVAEEERGRGRKPYVIPRGGACPLGVVGHVLAVAEFARQCAVANLTPDLVVLAVGSGATMAGWLLGSHLIGAPWKIEGVTVSRPADEARNRASGFFRDAAALVGLTENIDPEDIVIHDGFIGDGYGVPSEAGNAAIRTTARACGIFFDPVYTAKAFAGYLQLVEAGRFAELENVVFLHTGGEPSLFMGSFDLT